MLHSFHTEPICAFAQIRYKPLEHIVNRDKGEKPSLCFYCRRKRIGMLASTQWKGVVPKCNNPKAKAELASFASEITPQCGMPEVGFNEEGIVKHVQAYFNEQRRYRRNKSDSKVTFLVNFFHEFLSCHIWYAMARYAIPRYPIGGQVIRNILRCERRLKF